MLRFVLVPAVVLASVTVPYRGFAEVKPTAARTVAHVAEAARKSVVVISFAGRDGKRQGLGTGFVVGADGLIATNLHVLGEARPISVETPDGKHHAVTSVHASDRSLDLALIRIDAHDLPVLQLGDSERLQEGQAVVSIGNPHGLKNSVVSGVVSATRELDGRKMIQVAIPIEAGNSGGPLLDMEGRVQGILTMKSVLTPNLGFAVPINRLKPLLQKPNPVPIARWLTIGTLDLADWTILFDGRWRQRAGKIVAEGVGSGFGGRTLCLSQQAPPSLPYELAVTVKLDDEAGAAGLIFHADGGNKHYGFYPSAGQLRLTRFDGPDVYSWTILEQKPSPLYRLGEWNALKVRIEKEKILCYVNNHLVIESTDTGLTGGKVGLAKFRNTAAEFKHFKVAKEIKDEAPPAELVKRITKAVEKLPATSGLQSAVVEALLPNAAASVSVLRDRAKALEKEAVQLRDLAQAVHQKTVQTELLKILQGNEESIDLPHAALLLARLDNDDLDVEIYRKEFERMARAVAVAVPKGANDEAKLAALNKYLFTERGFHGSRSDYYNKANSYLNEVLDDREGLPITLSVLYIELAQRVGVKVVGVGLPGHFIVKHIPAKGEEQFLDIYENARAIPLKEARQMVRDYTERPPLGSDFAPVSKKAILVRMLHNLMGIARGENDVKAALCYLDTILVIMPESANERMLRAAARYQVGNVRGRLKMSTGFSITGRRMLIWNACASFGAFSNDQSDDYSSITSDLRRRVQHICDCKKTG